MTPLDRARLVSVLAVLAPLGAGLALHQYGCYERAIADIREVNVSLRVALQATRAAERRQAEVAEELAKVEADLVRLEEILPSTLSPDDVFRDLLTRASRAGLSVTENDFRADRDASPPKGELSVLVRGDDATLDRFTAGIKRWSRLTEYKELERGAGWRLAVLATWAAPEDREADADKYAVTARLPWLPPLSTVAIRKMADVTRLSAELASHRAADELRRRFERRKEQLQARVFLITDLKKEIDPDWLVKPD